MTAPIFNYDDAGDTLTISFFPGEAATGIELNDNLLLRINKERRVAVSLSVFNYSILTQKTEAGLWSLPLTGLDELTDATRQIVWGILRQEPLSEILSVSTYTPSLLEKQLIVTFRDSALVAAV
ncbi:DUF2283 domain-containing protein [bacterium]|nr:DUF2283 domain-containing protein [bacterium]